MQTYNIHHDTNVWMLRAADCTQWSGLESYLSCNEWKQVDNNK